MRPKTRIARAFKARFPAEDFDEKLAGAAAEIQEASLSFQMAAKAFRGAVWALPP